MNIEKFRYRIRRFNSLSIVKTIYVNFSCLPFNQAKKIPILIGRGTVLRSLKGNIKLNGKIRFGMISIGVNNIFNSHNSYKSIIDIDGDLIFNGKVDFNAGIVLKIFKTGTVEFGNRNSIGRFSQIISQNKISFGSCCRCSWNLYVSDTDFHFIKQKNGIVFNNVKSISIGNNCWIANNVSISKGSIIPNNTIVASNTFVNKEFVDEYTLLAGIPAELKKMGFHKFLKHRKKIIGINIMDGCKYGY